MLRHCASCAAQIPQTAPRCASCKTRYCGRDCQKRHWKGGHKQVCDQIKRRGGAEQCHAEKQCKDAVAVAVAKCADDTKGQTCYICTEAVVRRTGEGLVSGFCACRGGSSYAHVSCLAEQAKILIAEAEENNLNVQPHWKRWHMCSVCEQGYHGVVMCALGWACWKTYVGRPEANRIRRCAMTVLGNGLGLAGHHEDALSVQETEFSIVQRLGASEANLLDFQSNFAITYHNLGRDERALQIERDVYFGRLKLNGEQNYYTVNAANNYAVSLVQLKRFEEVKVLLRKTIPVARRVLGDSDAHTLRMRCNCAVALHNDKGATLDDRREAVTMLEDTARIARRVFGGTYPLTVDIEEELRRAALAARETQPCTCVPVPPPSGRT